MLPKTPIPLMAILSANHGITTKQYQLVARANIRNGRLDTTNICSGSKQVLRKELAAAYYSLCRSTPADCRYPAAFYKARGECWIAARARDEFRSEVISLSPEAETGMTVLGFCQRPRRQIPSLMLAVSYCPRGRRSFLPPDLMAAYIKQL